ncbi:MAG: DUF1328 domain-containing protein [Commensalibacter sp.]|nr:DUF1328 domain-containing protein [Commensalibacter sp.]MCT6895818.1 DUF1328 domain-containing protein [Commensalibacter sp.]
MLKIAFICLLIALLAWLFGFTSVAIIATGIAKIIFFIALLFAFLFFILAFLVGRKLLNN